MTSPTPPVAVLALGKPVPWAAVDHKDKKIAGELTGSSVVTS